MIIFCDLMIMLLSFGLVILCRCLIDYAFYKEPLQVALRRRKAWLIKMKALKEFDLFMLKRKSYNDSVKEEKRLQKITKLKYSIIEFESELDFVLKCIYGFEKDEEIEKG